MTLSSQRRQNLGYWETVGSLLGWHHQPCKEKSNKIGVRGSLGARSPAAWPHDPNLLAKPKKADKPHWLQTGDYQAGACAGLGQGFSKNDKGNDKRCQPGQGVWGSPIQSILLFDRVDFNLVEECVRTAHREGKQFFYLHCYYPGRGPHALH